MTKRLIFFLCGAILFGARSPVAAQVDAEALLARRDMEWDFGGKKLKRVHVLSAQKWGSRYNDLVKQFDQTFRKGS